MRGKLHKENDEWFIKYTAHHGVDGGDTWEESIPLHPDDVEFNSYQLYQDKEVIFEPVLIKNPNGEIDTKTGWRGKLIIGRPQLSCDWDNIFAKCGQFESLANFLKKNYHPPLKK